MNFEKGTVSIICDDRERASGIPERLEAFAHVAVVMQRLPRGDYRVDGKVLLERKTIADFALSIIDARLFKQAAALLKSPYRGAFLLEGQSSEFKHTGMSREALQGAFISLSLIYNIPILRSLDKDESARMLVYTANQLRRVGKGLYPLNRYVPKCRRGRQLRLLQSLPGIGRERARLLLKEFGTVENCLTAKVETLLRIEGIGRKTAEGIRKVVGERKGAYRNGAKISP